MTCGGGCGCELYEVQAYSLLISPDDSRIDAMFPESAGSTRYSSAFLSDEPAGGEKCNMASPNVTARHTIGQVSFERAVEQGPLA